MEHTGTITDTSRCFPGTDTPCSYLQQGSLVNVYLTWMSSQIGGGPSSPIDVDDPDSAADPPQIEVEDLDSEEESTAPMTEAEMEAVFRATEAKYGPKFFESETGMRRGNPNPNHPDNRSSPPADDSSVRPLRQIGGKMGSVAKDRGTEPLTSLSTTTWMI